MRSEGRLRVIVGVALPRGAKEHPPGSKAERRAIDEAQERLISELRPFDVEVNARYDTFAMLALEVDGAGLRHLLASPRVENVWEDRAIPVPSVDSHHPG